MAPWPQAATPGQPLAPCVTLGSHQAQPAQRLACGSLDLSPQSCHVWGAVSTSDLKREDMLSQLWQLGDLRSYSSQ